MNGEETVTTDSQPAAPPSDSIRITRQGKIRHWVKHGLDFFQENLDKPLTLQTSPADVTQSTIPRLISVVEILKREYLKTLDVSSGQLTGLHQYNELQWERRGEIPAEGEDRASSIARALEGKNHPKLTLTPYMKVTLCTKALEGMHEKKDVTYQTPQTRRLSKNTKARLKKKALKQQTALP
ncbi:hypothetical protein DEU56DRAFT_789536 [Suillus clintonianus]|uniref:uncharacterized protein n=1 Tax=Suillus clintonianus TaxID=1904413 RepID=UPI001B86D999|nr:uncharacterized protein DEU56DRAFT_789536 [Suillus clintonianus]KAG2145226.1 hypothetical protein DEU56DRAFT_789536 [Suillus clintonianus]